jgi:hypothetical protein
MDIVLQNTKPFAEEANTAIRKGSESPIPSEPAPRFRPWMAPLGATPTEQH